MSGISSADLAGASANEALRKADDQAVVIKWMRDRISELESKAGLMPDPCPELPSARLQRLTMEYFQALQKQCYTSDQ